MSNKRAYNDIPNLNGTKSTSRRSGKSGRTRKVHPSTSTNTGKQLKSGTRKIAFKNNNLSAEPQSLVQSLLEIIRKDEARLAEKYAELEKARQERYLDIKRISNGNRKQLPHDVLYN